MTHTKTGPDQFCRYDFNWIKQANILDVYEENIALVLVTVIELKVLLILYLESSNFATYCSNNPCYLVTRDHRVVGVSYNMIIRNMQGESEKSVICAAWCQILPILCNSSVLGFFYIRKFVLIFGISMAQKNFREPFFTHEIKSSEKQKCVNKLFLPKSKIESQNLRKFANLPFTVLV